MIQVITVEREYGTQGSEYARLLAESLGWGLIDEELVKEIAKRAKVSDALVRSYDEKLDPWFKKVSHSLWQGGNERVSAMVQSEVFDSTRMTGLIRSVMEEKARK